MDILLFLTIFVPLAGALMIAGLAEAGRHVVRMTALAAALVTLALAVGLIAQYQPPAVGRPDAFAVKEIVWLAAPESGLELRFSLGLDGLSLWLFGLSALLSVTAVLVSWESVRDQPRGFYAALLILETGMLGVFAARDIILFYVFFEFTLVPLLFLIGIWGSEERRYAAMKFFLFTFAGSALTFLGLLAIVLWQAGYIGATAAWNDVLRKEYPGYKIAGQQLTFDIQELTKGLAARPVNLIQVLDRPSRRFVDMPAMVDNMLSRDEAETSRDVRKQAAFDRLDANGNGRLTADEIRGGDARLQWWIFLALFVGFAIKVPLFPLHTWLPLAHVQAPTAGSVLLAGVLLKIGTYGFVRFCLPMLPEASAECMPWVLWLSVIGIIYGALVALAQNDIKRLIAYSSVSHLGFCMVGLFALNKLGLAGGTLQMINHGLSTGALFAIVGMLYERYHTRKIAAFSGLARRWPLLAFFLLLFTFSSIGLPGLNGFAGEILLLLGMFQRGVAPGEHSRQFLWIAVLAVSGVVLGAWYMLLLVQRTFFGPLREPTQEAGHDDAGHQEARHHGAGHAKAHGMRWTEIAALAPLAVLVVWIGVQPDFFLRRMEGTLDPLAGRLEQVVNQRTQAAVESQRRSKLNADLGALTQPRSPSLNPQPSTLNSQP